MGVGLLILLENLIPPIPSEVILPLAGFRARTGTLNVVAVWLAARIYRVGLLMYGKRPSFRELGRWMMQS